MYRIKFIYLVLLIAASPFYSCIKQNSPPIPSYVYVPTIQFQAGNPTDEGSADHYFEDAWISVDLQLIGANNLPTLLPVIHNDTLSNNLIKVSAGIQENGISSSRVRYPFFEPFEQYLDLEPGKVDTIYPIFSYANDVKFRFIDDFESAGTVFGVQLDDYSETEMISQSEDVFEGVSSGQLYIDSANIECYVRSFDEIPHSDLQSPTVVTPVYLEMHYKTDVPISVGLVAKYNGAPEDVLIKGGVNPTDGWKKIYFNITEDIYRLNAASYSIVLRALYNSDAPSFPKVYVDNIRIVHY